MRPSPEGGIGRAGSAGHGQEPVCILGMHRSGTSLTARILNLLGLDLGPEEAMLEALEHDNPEGFWEQRAIMELNDELLARLGGFWWRLPELPPGWAESPELEPLRKRARAILAERFTVDRLWGFKDPRVSVTLPFWRTLVPSLRYVLCVRNPLAVAASLETRDPKLHSRQESMELWLAYNARALLGTRGRPRLVVFYEDYLRDVDEQVDRLAVFLDGKAVVSDVARSEARHFFQAELDHHRANVPGSLASPDVTVEAAALLAALKAAHADGAQVPRDVEEAAVDALAEKLLAGGARAADHGRGRKPLREELKAAERLASLEREVVSLRGEACGRAEAVRQAKALERELASLRVKLRRELERRDRELGAIQGSLSWRLTRPLRGAKGSLGRRIDGRLR